MEVYATIQGKLGSWKYYSTKMTARKLAGNVKFASEIWDAKALDFWIQRILDSSRAKEQIASYLAKHEDRFFNSIVVAALEGDPVFFPVDLAEDPRFELLKEDAISDAFGVLKFDGKQKYYVLDGQHRLRAIRALIDQETDYEAPDGFEDDEFPVIIVVPKPEENKEAFLRRYRRLFSHLNRYAKPMDKATTIIMEEDDAFAICTRRLIQEHEFFQWFEDEKNARVKVTKGKNLRNDESYFTNIETLYELTIKLLYSRYRQNGDEHFNQGKNAKQRLSSFLRFRPEDEFIDLLYQELALYWDSLLEALPALRGEARLMRSDLGDDVETEDGTMSNHLLFRPIGQVLFCELVRRLLDQGLEDPTNPDSEGVRKVLRGLASIEWRLHSAPWRHLLLVFDEEGGGQRWTIRNESRKKAVDIGMSILCFITGVTPSDQESLNSLRNSWSNMLLRCDANEQDSLWNDIIRQAQSFRECRVD